MGFKCEYNYILRLRPDQGLTEIDLSVGKAFRFEKEGHRIYPIDVPIDLANEKWEIIGRVVVSEITIGKGQTKGECGVLLLYSAEEKETLTRLNRQGEEKIAARSKQY
jgi:hypothetical protein